MIGASTKTDLAANQWAIDDGVTRLRKWGTDAIRDLSAFAGDEYTIGASEDCEFQLDDPSGCVSRLHASLVRDRGQWRLRDLGSKNGVHFDGARGSELVLAPGVEIGIGGVTLIAESERSVALRSFLSRLLGWRSDRTPIVDHALRAVRLAAARRAALVLCGEGDLVPIAQSLHRHAIGAERPFVVCDPKRQRSKATVRSAENFDTGLGALLASAGGTLCVRSRRLPADFPAVIHALRDPASRTQLVVCARSPAECEPFLAAPIAIPPLASRALELDQIINEYADDAVAELSLVGGERVRFLRADRIWVRTHSATSLPEIEKATLRLVAIRQSRNISNAAARLGMAPVSLSRWIGRRGLPMSLEP